MMTDDPHMHDAERLELLDGLILEPASKRLAVDVEAYRHFLEESDLSEAQQRELIETLWNVIVSFVDLGFGVSPLSEWAEEGTKTAPQVRTDQVQLSDPHHREHQETAEGDPSLHEEREDS